MVSAWRVFKFGVVAKTTADRQKYWKALSIFATMCDIPPSLHNTEHLERDIVICAIANKVKGGKLGRKHQVTVQTVSTALASTSMTVQLTGQPIPVYCKANKNYHLNIG